jgi:hypothetical protein
MVTRKTGADLALLAKEINTRLSKADKIESQAGNHRVAACVRLAEAKITCRSQGIPFKKWAEDNVEYAYETVRKYAAIGGSSDPQKALDNWKARAQKGMAALRARREPRTITDDTPEGRHRRTQKEIFVSRFQKVPEKERADALREVLASDKAAADEALKEPFLALRPKDKLAFVYWAAEEAGVELADEEELKTA